MISKIVVIREGIEYGILASNWKPYLAFLELEKGFDGSTRFKIGIIFQERGIPHEFIKNYTKFIAKQITLLDK